MDEIAARLQPYRDPHHVGTVVGWIINSMFDGAVHRQGRDYQAIKAMSTKGSTDSDSLPQKPY
jgi:hypothetical protein